MRQKNVREISHFARIKSYPGGGVEIMAAERPIFRDAGWEAADDWAAAPTKKQRGEAAGTDKAASLDRAMRRARAQVRDIALCNGFRWFVTLTLDAARVDRYDMAAITRKLNAWLDNQVRRRGLRYVLVPERHKDGAIHFHGFFSDALEAVDSRHKDKQGHKVYNLPGWTLGFTSAVEVYGDYAKAVGYVCKYIGKQGDKPGGRWYYSGGALARPEVELVDISVDNVAAMPGSYTFCVREARLGMAIWRGVMADDTDGFGLGAQGGVAQGTVGDGADPVEGAQPAAVGGGQADPGGLG